MNATPHALPDDSCPALIELTDATRAWLEMFGEGALDTYGGLLEAVTHEARRRHWTVRLSVGDSVTGDIELNEGDHMIGGTYTDVTAAMAQIVLTFVRVENEVGTPLYPRRGTPLVYRGRPAARDASGTLGTAGDIQAMFDRLAAGYGFEGPRGALGEDGGTLRYHQAGYTLELSALPQQSRKRLTYTGMLTRHFQDGQTLRHAVPVHEVSEYTHKALNRQWRDSAERFTHNLARAAAYVSVPGDDGWAYGHITQLRAGKGTGCISNVGDGQILFTEYDLLDPHWRPEVADRVRFRCEDALRSHEDRPSPYSAKDIVQVDGRVTLREFL